MRTKAIKSISLICVFFAAVAIKSFGQNDAAADTSGFSVNNTGGWQLFNSYVAPYNTDSVQLEIIVRHSNNIKLSEEQFVGKVKALNLLPFKTQTVSFNLIKNYYALRIDPNGKCYLRFVSGIPPDADPFTIPVKVYFKK